MESSLRTYVTTMRSLGYADREIIHELLNAGWETTLLSALLGTDVPDAIRASGLTRIYEDASGGTVALRDADLSIQKGESVAVVGKSGSGKSTLMHILATLDRPTSGSLAIDGRPTTELSAKELDRLRNKKVSFVFQQFFLNGRATSLENVMLPLTIAGVPTEERIERARAALAAVDLSEKELIPAAKLSGGQKQRLCIARALVTEPEIIFADEPTGNLDTENGNIITDLLFRIQRERAITLVVVTHDPDLANLCDRTITISDGAIVTSPSHAN